MVMCSSVARARAVRRTLQEAMWREGWTGLTVLVTGKWVVAGPSGGKTPWYDRGGVIAYRLSPGWVDHARPPRKKAGKVKLSRAEGRSQKGWDKLNFWSDLHRQMLEDKLGQAVV